MLEGLVADLLTRLLGQYIKVDRKSISLGIWHGKLELHHLEVHPDAITVLFDSVGLDLPVSISKGTVDKLVVEVPWQNLKSKAVKVRVENLKVWAQNGPSWVPGLSTTTPEKEFDEKAYRESREWKAKKARLENDNAIRQAVWLIRESGMEQNENVDLEAAAADRSPFAAWQRKRQHMKESQREILSPSSPSSSSSSPSFRKAAGSSSILSGWTSSIASSIAEKIQIEIDNVQVVYDDEYSDPSNPYCMHLAMNSMIIDKYDLGNVSTDDQPNSVHKSFSLNQFSVTWSPFHLRDDPFLSPSSELRYLISPVSTQLLVCWLGSKRVGAPSKRSEKLSRLKHDSTASASHARPELPQMELSNVTIDLLVDDLEVCLDQFQYCTIMKTVARITNQNMRSPAHSRWHQVIDTLMPGMRQRFRDQRALESSSVRDSLNALSVYVEHRLAFIESMRLGQIPNKACLNGLEYYEYRLPEHQIIAFRDLADYKHDQLRLDTSSGNKKDLIRMAKDDTGIGTNYNPKPSNPRNASEVIGSVESSPIAMKTKSADIFAFLRRGKAPNAKNTAIASTSITAESGKSSSGGAESSPDKSTPQTSRKVMFADEISSAGTVESARNLGNRAKSWHQGWEIQGANVERSSAPSVKNSDFSFLRSKSQASGSISQQNDSDVSIDGFRSNQEEQIPWNISRLAWDWRHSRPAMDLRVGFLCRKGTLVLFEDGFVSQNERKIVAQVSLENLQAGLALHSKKQLVVEVLLKAISVRDPQSEAYVLYSRCDMIPREAGNNALAEGLYPKNAQAALEQLRECTQSSEINALSHIAALRIIHPLDSTEKIQPENGEGCSCGDSVSLASNGNSCRCGYPLGSTIEICIGPMDAIFDGPKGAFFGMIRHFKPPEEIVPAVRLLSSLGVPHLETLRRTILFMHAKRSKGPHLELHIADPRFVLPSDAMSLLKSEGNLSSIGPVLVMEAKHLSLVVPSHARKFPTSTVQFDINRWSLDNLRVVMVESMVQFRQHGPTSLSEKSQMIYCAGGSLTAYKLNSKLGGDPGQLARAEFAVSIPTAIQLFVNASMVCQLRVWMNQRNRLLSRAQISVVAEDGQKSRYAHSEWKELYDAAVRRSYLPYSSQAAKAGGISKGGGTLSAVQNIDLPGEVSDSGSVEWDLRISVSSIICSCDAFAIRSHDLGLYLKKATNLSGSVAIAALQVSEACERAGWVPSNLLFSSGCQYRRDGAADNQRSVPFWKEGRSQVSMNYLQELSSYFLLADFAKGAVSDIKVAPIEVNIAAESLVAIRQFASQLMHESQKFGVEVDLLVPNSSHGSSVLAAFSGAKLVFQGIGIHCHSHVGALAVVQIDGIFVSQQECNDDGSLEIRGTVDGIKVSDLTTAITCHKDFFRYQRDKTKPTGSSADGFHARIWPELLRVALASKRESASEQEEDAEEASFDSPFVMNLQPGPESEAPLMIEAQFSGFQIIHLQRTLSLLKHYFSSLARGEKGTCSPLDHTNSTTFSSRDSPDSIMNQFLETLGESYVSALFRPSRWLIASLRLRSLDIIIPRNSHNFHEALRFTVRDCHATSTAEPTVGYGIGVYLKVSGVQGFLCSASEYDDDKDLHWPQDLKDQLSYAENLGLPFALPSVSPKTETQFMFDASCEVMIDGMRLMPPSFGGNGIVSCQNFEIAQHACFDEPKERLLVQEKHLPKLRVRVVGTDTLRIRLCESHYTIMYLLACENIPERADLDFGRNPIPDLLYSGVPALPEPFARDEVLVEAEFPSLNIVVSEGNERLHPYGNLLEVQLESSRLVLLSESGQRLQGKLFSNVKFVNDIRLHSQDVVKLIAAPMETSDTSQTREQRHIRFTYDRVFGRRTEMICDVMGLRMMVSVDLVQSISRLSLPGSTHLKTTAPPQKAAFLGRTLLVTLSACQIWLPGEAVQDRLLGLSLEADVFGTIRWAPATRDKDISVSLSGLKASFETLSISALDETWLRNSDCGRPVSEPSSERTLSKSSSYSLNLNSSPRWIPECSPSLQYSSTQSIPTVDFLFPCRLWIEVSKDQSTGKNGVMIRVDSLAFSLDTTQLATIVSVIKRVAQGLDRISPKRTSNPEIVVSHVNVSVAMLQCVLSTKDMQNRTRNPLVDIRLDNIMITADLPKIFRVETGMSVNAFDLRKASWVPLMEPWSFCCVGNNRAVKTVHEGPARSQPGYAGIGADDDQPDVCILFHSLQHLDLNVSLSSIRGIQAAVGALKTAYESVGKPVALRRIRACSDTQVSNASSYSSGGVSFLLRNETGKPVSIWTLADSSRRMVQPYEEQRITVHPGRKEGQATSSGRQEEAARPAHATDISQCVISVTGYDSHVVSVRKIGQTLIRMHPDTSSLDSPFQLKYSHLNTSIDVILDILVHEGLPLAVLRSPLRIVNETCHRVEVMIGEGSFALLRTVGPKQSFFVPVHLVSKKIQVRPTTDLAEDDSGTLPEVNYVAGSVTWDTVRHRICAGFVPHAHYHEIGLKYGSRGECNAGAEVDTAKVGGLSGFVKVLRGCETTEAEWEWSNALPSIDTLLANNHHDERYPLERSGSSSRFLSSRADSEALRCSPIYLRCPKRTSMVGVGPKGENNSAFVGRSQSRGEAAVDPLKRKSARDADEFGQAFFFAAVARHGDNQGLGTVDIHLGPPVMIKNGLPRPILLHFVDRAGKSDSLKASDVTSQISEACLGVVYVEPCKEVSLHRLLPSSNTYMSVSYNNDAKPSSPLFAVANRFVYFCRLTTENSTLKCIPPLSEEALISAALIRKSGMDNGMAGPTGAGETHNHSSLSLRIENVTSYFVHRLCIATDFWITNRSLTPFYCRSRSSTAIGESVQLCTHPPGSQDVDYLCLSSPYVSFQIGDEGMIEKAPTSLHPSISNESKSSGSGRKTRKWLSFPYRLTDIIKPVHFQLSGRDFVLEAQAAGIGDMNQTLVCTIRDAWWIENRTSMDVDWCFCGNDRSPSAKDDSRSILLPAHSIRPLSASQSVWDRNCISFRIRSKEPWEWSPPVPLELRSTVPCKLYKPKSHDVYIAELAVTALEGGSKVISIHPENIDFPPYRIHNVCTRTSIAFSQINPNDRHESHAFWLLRPDSSCRYAWDTPAAKHRLLLVQLLEAKRSLNDTPPEVELSIDIVSLVYIKPCKALQSGICISVYVDGSTKIITFRDWDAKYDQDRHAEGQASILHNGIFIDLRRSDSRHVYRAQLGAGFYLPSNEEVLSRSSSVRSLKSLASSGSESALNVLEHDIRYRCHESPAKYSSGLFSCHMFKLELWVPSVGVSLIHDGSVISSDVLKAPGAQNPVANQGERHGQELVYILASDVRLLAISNPTRDSVACVLEIWDLQADNLLSSAVWPVLLYSRGNKRTSLTTDVQHEFPGVDDFISNSSSCSVRDLGSWGWYLRANSRSLPIVRMGCELSNISELSEKTIMMRDVKLIIQPLVINLDEDFVLQAWEFGQSIARLTEDSQAEPIGFGEEVWFQKESIESRDVASGQSLVRTYIEHLFLASIFIDLSFTPSNSSTTRRYQNNQPSLGRALIATLGNVQNATLIFNALELSHVFDSVQHFKNLMVEFYTEQFSAQRMTFITSNQLLGNPSALFDYIAMGARDFVIEPSKATGSIDFLAGIGRGSSSLVTNTIFGVFNSLAGIPNAVSHGLEAAIGDAEYLAERESIRAVRRHTPSPATGLVSGALSFGHSIASGTAGLFRDPIMMVNQEGPGGLIGGIGKGLAGLVLKPLTGALDLVAEPIHGFQILMRGSRVRRWQHAALDADGRDHVTAGGQDHFSACELLMEMRVSNEASTLTKSSSRVADIGVCLHCAFCEVPARIRAPRPYETNIGVYDFRHSVGCTLLRLVHRNQGQEASELLQSWVPLAGIQEELVNHLEIVFSTMPSLREPNGGSSRDVIHNVVWEKRTEWSILNSMWTTIQSASPTNDHGRDLSSWTQLTRHDLSCGSHILAEASKKSGVLRPKDLRVAMITSSRLLITTLAGKLVWDEYIENLVDIQVAPDSRDSIVAMVQKLRTKSPVAERIHCGSSSAREALVVYLKHELASRHRRNRIAVPSDQAGDEPMVDLSFADANDGTSLNIVSTMISKRKTVVLQDIDQFVLQEGREFESLTSSYSQQESMDSVSVSTPESKWKEKQAKSELLPHVGSELEPVADAHLLARRSGLLQDAILRLHESSALFEAGDLRENRLNLRQFIRIVLVNLTDNDLKIDDYGSNSGSWSILPPVHVLRGTAAILQLESPVNTMRLSDLNAFLVMSRCCPERQDQRLVLVLVKTSLGQNYYIAKTPTDLAVFIEQGQNSMPHAIIQISNVAIDGHRQVQASRFRLLRLLQYAFAHTPLAMKVPNKLQRLKSERESRRHMKSDISDSDSEEDWNAFEMEIERHEEEKAIMFLQSLNFDPEDALWAYRQSARNLRETISTLSTI